MLETFKAIDTYGLWTVFVGGVMALLYKYFRIKLKRYEHRAYSIKMTVPREHYFFSKVEYILEYQLPRLQLFRHGEYHEGRSILFKSLLATKFKMWKNTMYSICDTNYEKTSRENMGKDILQKLLKLISAYEQHWLNSGVPPLVIEKFNRWHGIRADLFISGVDRICNGRSFDTKTEIKLAILEISVSLLLHTILDTEQTLGDLNGELEGLKYLGHTL